MKEQRKGKWQMASRKWKIVNVTPKVRKISRMLRNKIKTKNTISVGENGQTVSKEDTGNIFTEIPKEEFLRDVTMIILKWHQERQGHISWTKSKKNYISTKKKNARIISRILWLSPNNFGYVNYTISDIIPYHFLCFPWFFIGWLSVCQDVFKLVKNQCSLYYSYRDTRVNWPWTGFLHLINC